LVKAYIIYKNVKIGTGAIIEDYCIVLYKALLRWVNKRGALRPLLAAMPVYVLTLLYMPATGSEIVLQPETRQI